MRVRKKSAPAKTATRARRGAGAWPQWWHWKRAGELKTGDRIVCYSRPAKTYWVASTVDEVVVLDDHVRLWECGSGPGYKYSTPKPGKRYRVAADPSALALPGPTDKPRGSSGPGLEDHAIQEARAYEERVRAEEGRVGQILSLPAGEDEADLPF